MDLPMVRRGTHVGKAGSNKGKIWPLLTMTPVGCQMPSVTVTERKSCMKIALTEKEAELLKFIRGVDEGKVCIEIVAGNPESIILKREINLAPQCDMEQS